MVSDEPDGQTPTEETTTKQMVRDSSATPAWPQGQQALKYP